MRAEFAAAFLAVHGAATILATSREALAIDGEQVCPRWRLIRMTRVTHWP